MSEGSGRGRWVVTLLVAAGLWLSQSSRYRAVHESLARCSGFAIAAIGLWRLGRALGGYDEHEEEPEVRVSSGTRGLVGLGIAGGLVPCWDAVALIVLAEAFKIRSLLINTAVGAALLVAGYYGSGLSQSRYEESIDAPPPVIPRQAEIAAAAGAVGGFIYWFIAGRNAGRWRERGRAST